MRDFQLEAAVIVCVMFFVVFCMIAYEYYLRKDKAANKTENPVDKPADILPVNNSEEDAPIVLTWDDIENGGDQLSHTLARYAASMGDEQLKRVYDFSITIHKYHEAVCLYSPELYNEMVFRGLIHNECLYSDLED